jgi:NADH-quinone oxidoreductase subunit L
MFLALGIGAWSAGIFHFMIHAFFKALLFLGAGAVIHALHNEQDMFKMGGLKNKMPVIYWTFLIGAASLAALPIFTGGFYSKDQILWLTWSGENSNIWFFLAALGGAFITSIYTFRMIFVTFFGAEQTHIGHMLGMSMTLPLVILAALSTFAGFLELPHTFGHLTIFSDMLSPVLPAVSLREGVESSEWIIQTIAAVTALSGVYVAYYFYQKRSDLLPGFKSAIRDTYNFWFGGWGFDTLYNTLFVRPFVYIATINKNDVVDKFYAGLVHVAELFNHIFVKTQNGILRWYIMGVVIGAILILTLSLIVNQ